MSDSQEEFERNFRGFWVGAEIPEPGDYACNDIVGKMGKIIRVEERAPGRGWTCFLDNGVVCHLGGIGNNWKLHKQGQT
ncbi:MAG: hypothetical protein M0R32_11030 [Candidatus Cloacimonetes bacterium]|jgi:hypothetical protein|nr:hypothetical protein [Candidatus Cloacimonadota bacterium]